MTRVLFFSFLLIFSGCTTLRPIDAYQDDFSQRIASGELLKIHDHVVIETKDRQTYEFEITSLSATNIDGKHQSIPIDQIVSIEKREVNTKKTLLLVLLIAGGIAFTVVLVSALKAAGEAALFGSSH